MKRNLIYISLLFLLLFAFCQRRVFVHVTLKGVLIDYFTNEPIDATLRLFTDNPSAFNQSGILKEGSTNSDGSFTLKSRAIWKKEYYLSYFNKKDSTGGFIFGGKIPNNTTEELGTRYPDHKFTCQLTLKSVSTNTLYISQSSNTTIYTPGTNTTIIHSDLYSKTQFESGNHIYVIGYSIDSNFTTYHRKLNIPITTSSDLQATLNF